MSSDHKLNTTIPDSPSLSLDKPFSNDKPEFGDGKQVTEADNLMSKTDPDAAEFMAQRNEMLQN